MSKEVTETLGKEIKEFRKRAKWGCLEWTRDFKVVSNKIVTRQKKKCYLYILNRERKERKTKQKHKFFWTFKYIWNNACHSGWYGAFILPISLSHHHNSASLYLSFFFSLVPRIFFCLWPWNSCLASLSFMGFLWVNSFPLH